MEPKQKIDFQDFTEKENRIYLLQIQEPNKSPYMRYAECSYDLTNYLCSHPDQTIVVTGVSKI